MLKLIKMFKPWEAGYLARAQGFLHAMETLYQLSYIPMDGLEAGKEDSLARTI